MAVTKQTYTISANPTWTAAQAADMFRDAFIDAGYMTAWRDSFLQSPVEHRVLQVVHDNTKAYGSSFYVFSFRAGFPFGVSLMTGWNDAANLGAGTQFLDFHVQPADMNISNAGWGATPISSWGPSTSSDLFLDRYTSQDDAKQSWFVLRQGTNLSSPFSILHPSTVLHSWLDLNRGIVNGYITANALTSAGSGMLSFRQQENIRRSLILGTALRGDTTTGASSGTRFHQINYNTYAYQGLGAISNNTLSNYGEFDGTLQGGGITLPVGLNSANPAFATNYVPICSDLPWSLWTPTRLADDFGVYMHYVSNAIAYGNRFIINAGTNEWEVIAFANNATLNDGASATFLARVV
jgi:hypothetical protein